MDEEKRNGRKLWKAINAIVGSTMKNPTTQALQIAHKCGLDMYRKEYEKDHWSAKNRMSNETFERVFRDKLIY
jgi:hypothetical protein